MSIKDQNETENFKGWKIPCFIFKEKKISKTFRDENLFNPF